MKRIKSKLFLKIFTKIVRSYTCKCKYYKRTTDAVGRYGGEEFIGIYSDVEEKT